MSFLKDMIDKARGLLTAAPPNAIDAIEHDPLDAAMFRELMAECPPLTELVDDLDERHADAQGMVRDTVMRFWQGWPRLRESAEMAPGYETHHALATMLAQLPEIEELRAASKHDRYGAAVMTVSVADTVRNYLQEHEDVNDAAEESQEAAERRDEAIDQLTEALAQAMAADAEDDTEDEDGEPGEGEGEGEGEGDGEPDPNAITCGGGPTDGPGEPGEGEGEGQGQGQGTEGQGQGESQGQSAISEAAAQALAEAIAAAQAAQEAAAAAQAQARAKAQQMAENIKAEVRQNTVEAKEDLEQEEAFLRAWGANEGQLQRMSYADRVAQVQRLNSTRLGKFREIVGRFRMKQLAMRAKHIEYAREVVVDVELGNDLTRVLPSELALLALPGGEDVFMMKFLSGQLLSYKYAGTERGGDGPIIVCLDSSDSMSWKDSAVNGVTPEAWSKAFTLALLGHARRSQRDVHVIHYASHRDPLIEQTFRKGHAPLSTIVDMVETFIAGGTYFPKPLDRAAELIRTTSVNRKADVVFVTDGQSRVDPTWLENFQRTKHDLGFRVFGMMIGRDSTGGIEPFSDNVRNITDFVADEVADVFQLLH